jgi:hypothetical protein
MKGNQYTISFNEEDAEKNGSNFIFDQNNDKFQLTPVANSPLPNNNDKVDGEFIVQRCYDSKVKFAKKLSDNSEERIIIEIS